MTRFLRKEDRSHGRVITLQSSLQFKIRTWTSEPKPSPILPPIITITDPTTSAPNASIHNAVPSSILNASGSALDRVSASDSAFTDNHLAPPSTSLYTHSVDTSSTGISIALNDNDIARAETSLESARGAVEGMKSVHPDFSRTTETLGEIDLTATLAGPVSTAVGLLLGKIQALTTIGDAVAQVFYNHIYIAYTILT